MPDQIADVLPAQARFIEELRRRFLDTARSYGYELVMPPLLEHLESLLSGTGEALDLQTFKLVDQLSGRTLGLRADTTTQVARIDAHLLGRNSVTRLCYCGPVLHTRTEHPHATREPLQLGAEIYGHSGPEADLEVQLLALQGLAHVGTTKMCVDMADVRIAGCLLAQAGVVLQPKQLNAIHTALATKDASTLTQLTSTMPQAVRTSLQTLLQLYGDAHVLDEAQKALKGFAGIDEPLANLKWLAQHVQQIPGVEVSFDLADLSGYAYYSGTRFAIYAQGSELVRGGRYDEVGAVFGRRRAAVGFSLDLKELADVLPQPAIPAAVRAPWNTDAGLQTAMAQLRAQGEIVICVLPGHEHEVDEFSCDRELIQVNGQWVVHPLKN